MISHPACDLVIAQPLQLDVWRGMNHLAPGTPPGTPNPLGFAAVRFSLKNESDRTIQVQIQTIAVRAVNSATTLMSLPQQTITLHPQEIAPQRYQLSSLAGYGSVPQVDAIVDYTVDNQHCTLQSSPVRV